MKVLVTGGAGVIGSHLCDALIYRGDDVLCIDNLVTGRRDNVDHLLTNDRFKFIDCNILRNPLYPGPSIETLGCIFHLASITDPSKCKDRVSDTLEANIQGTINLLKLAEDHKIPLLFASSVRVLDSVTDCYREGKRVGELLCNQYNQKIARMGNTYGPRMDKNDGRVIPTFIRRALNNEIIEIWGDGMQEDSFCYVKDIVDGLIKFMDSRYIGVIEFGSRELISILDLARLILGIVNSSSPIRFKKVSMRDSFRGIANNTKANRLLGWTPRTALWDGLKEWGGIKEAV